MANMIMLGGSNVDADDPCALYQALYSVKLRLIAGEKMEETEIRSPATNRRLRVGAGNIKSIDDELQRLAMACSAKNGSGRTRFAKRIRFSC